MTCIVGPNLWDAVQYISYMFSEKRKSQEIYSKHPPLKKLQLDSDTLQNVHEMTGGGLVKAGRSLPSLPNWVFLQLSKVPYNKASTTLSLPLKKNTNPPQFLQKKITGFSSFSSWICMALMLGKKFPKSSPTWR